MRLYLAAITSILLIGLLPIVAPAAEGPYEGQTMDRVLAIKTRGLTPTLDSLDVLFDLLIEQVGSVSTIYEHHTERDMNLALIQPWCSINRRKTPHFSTARGSPSSSSTASPSSAAASSRGPGRAG